MNNDTVPYVFPPDSFRAGIYWLRYSPDGAERWHALVQKDGGLYDSICPSFAEARAWIKDNV